MVADAISGLANTSGHSLFLDIAGGDDAEHDHGQQRDNQECQQTDEHLGDSLAILGCLRARVIAPSTPRSRDVLRRLLRRPVRFRFFNNHLRRALGRC